MGYRVWTGAKELLPGAKGYIDLYFPNGNEEALIAYLRAISPAQCRPQLFNPRPRSSQLGYYCAQDVSLT